MYNIVISYIGPGKAKNANDEINEHGPEDWTSLPEEERYRKLPTGTKAMVTVFGSHFTSADS